MLKKILNFIESTIPLFSSMELEIDYKNNNEIITNIDKKISKNFSKFIKKNFQNLNYTIIDEEKHNILKKSDYQFIIDPIDGTLPFSLKMPLYGISIAVFKKNKPYLGIIFIPATKELLYCNTKNVYFTENAFSDTQKTKVITKTYTSHSNIIFDTLFFVIMKNSLVKEKLVCCSFYSTIVQMMYLATGRAKGAYFSGYLWDIAGSWCILKKLGYQIKNIQNEQILSEISNKFFDEKLHIKGVFVISKPKIFKTLQNIAEIRKFN